jgi:hypothetical protein
LLEGIVAVSHSNENENEMKLMLLPLLIILGLTAFAAIPIDNCYGTAATILAGIRPAPKQALYRAYAAFNFDRIRAIINSQMSLFSPMKRRQIRKWLGDITPPSAVVALMANTTAAEKMKLKQAIDDKDPKSVIELFSPKVMALNTTDQAVIVSYFAKMLRMCFASWN